MYQLSSADFALLSNSKFVENATKIILKLKKKVGKENVKVCWYGEGKPVCPDIAKFYVLCLVDVKPVHGKRRCFDDVLKHCESLGVQYQYCSNGDQIALTYRLPTIQTCNGTLSGVCASAV